MLNMVNIIHLFTKIDATCVLSGQKTKLLPKSFRPKTTVGYIEFDKVH